MKRFLSAFIFTLVLSLNAWAADQFCGVDTDHSGAVDAACSGISDGDRDGQSTSTDCDDTNNRIYSGIAVATGCSAGEAKVCGAGGSYGACSSGGYCPSSCSKCYYLATTGSDSNAGTFAAPFLTPGKLTYYYQVADRPSGWIGLNGSECVFYRGGTYTSSYSYNGEMTHFRLEGKDGTLSNPTIIAAYPGEVVRINPASIKYPFEISNSAYSLIEGFQFYSMDVGSGSVLNYDCSGKSGSEARNLLIHDIDGVQDDNLAGIRSNTCTSARFHHNTIYDVRDVTHRGVTPVSINNSAILDFNSDDWKAYRNDICHAVANSVGGIKRKHTGAITTVAEVSYNTICNSGTPFQFSSSLWLHNNEIAAASGTTDFDWLKMGDLGGPANFSLNTTIEYNTIRGGAYVHIPTSTYGYAIGHVYYRNNVHIQPNSGARMVDFDQYGSDAIYTDFIAGGKYHSSANIYDATGSANLVFYFYNLGEPLGFSDSSLASHQARGYETGTYEEAPTLDSAGCATSAHSGNAGWCIAAPVGGGGGGSGSSNRRKGQAVSSGRKGQK